MASSFELFDKDSGGNGSFEPAVVEGKWTDEAELLLYCDATSEAQGQRRELCIQHH